MKTLNKKLYTLFFLFCLFSVLLIIVCFYLFNNKNLNIIIPKYPIMDERIFPQDLNAYLDIGLETDFATELDTELTTNLETELETSLNTNFETNLTDNSNTLLFTAEQSVAATENFKKKLLSSWNYTLPPTDSLLYYLGFFDDDRKNKGFRENLNPWTEKDWNLLAQNADYSNFPSMEQYAITLERVSVRLAPTYDPNFKSANKPGNSYPFDEFQQSALAIGSPITILHISQDKQWYFIKTISFPGWVDVKSVAFIEEEFYQTWHDSSFAAIIDDSVFLENGVQLNIGTVLPLSEKSLHTQSVEDKIHVLLPVRSQSSYAQIKELVLTQDQAIAMPMPFTPKNVAMLGNTFMHQPYGWGGLYGNRDCSSMLKDLFTPFGIWLPRNSKAQIHSGTYLDISKNNNHKKKEIILHEAIPFQTLIYLPGHIGLYVGDVNGNPLMFHNVFGLRTEDNGRLILGKTLVTSLEPAKEFLEIKENLIDRITAISIINQEIELLK